MNYPVFPYRIFPLGDSAISIHFGNCIDENINKEVIERFNQLRQQPLPGMIEAIPAYSSLTVCYDMLSLKKSIPGGYTVFDWMKEQLEERLRQPLIQNETKERLIKIPVCYEDEFAPDTYHLVTTKNITKEEMIQLHTSKRYKVYMLGFLPGFAYMGEVDEKIMIPRKPQPAYVEAGSVGIAGKQTGIYPLLSPGGWQIIGRTALRLFDAEKEEPTLLRAGDEIRFYPVSKKDFYEIQNSSTV